MSRFLLPIPVLFLPAFGNLLLEKLHLWPKNNKVAKFMELGLCTISVIFALPMTVAIFK